MPANRSQGQRPIIDLRPKIPVEAHPDVGRIARNHHFIYRNFLVKPEFSGEAIKRTSLGLVNVFEAGWHHPHSIIREQVKIPIKVIRTNHVQCFQNKPSDRFVFFLDSCQCWCHDTQFLKQGDRYYPSISELQALSLSLALSLAPGGHRVC